MILTLGFSPCPNDSFMFDAIVHRRIDLEGRAIGGVVVDQEGGFSGAGWGWRGL